jgi:NAD-dependent SIR2 family protein deacetylase
MHYVCNYKYVDRYIEPMAILNLQGKTGAQRCIMCEGSLEKANVGNVCNACKDKMRKL